MTPMNSSDANEIIFGYEVAANHLEHTAALFVAIAKLADSDEPDLTAVITLAKLGTDIAETAATDAREAGADAARELQAVTEGKQ